MDRSKWEYKKLGDICDKGSSNIAQNKIEDNTGDYALYGASGYVKSIDFYHQEQPYIGVVKDGSGVGRVNKYPAKSSLLGTMQYIFPKEGCDLGYLLYVLQGLHLEKYKTGAAIPHIYFKDYCKCEVPFPPITDQQRIVAELDCLNEMIAVKQEQLKEFDKLAQSIFYDMFGDPVVNPNRWESKTLERLIQDNIILYHLDGNHGGDYPRREEFVEQGVSYIGANNIKDGYIDFSGVKYLTEEKANTLRKGIAKNEDVLFAHNATVGPVALLRTTEEKVVLSTSLTAYRCNKQSLLPLFLKSYMGSTWFVNQYIHTMKQATRNQVPITQQRKMSFILPPLSLQQQFADKISAIEAQKELVKQSIAETQALLDYTMDKYFG